MIRKRKKIYKKRGSRRCGGGSAKNRKGAGHRGGRGHAGSGKEKKQKYPWFLKNKPNHIGRRGFKRPQNLKETKSVINLRYLNDNLEKLLKKGVASKEKNAVIVDVSKLGISKVLSQGVLTETFSVKAEEFSEKAKAKIEEMGGKAIVGEADV
jgi:large subunit ribosomal protein L15